MSFLWNHLHKDDIQRTDMYKHLQLTTHSICFLLLSQVLDNATSPDTTELTQHLSGCGMYTWK